MAAVNPFDTSSSTAPANMGSAAPVYAATGAGAPPPSNPAPSLSSGYTTDISGVNNAPVAQATNAPTGILQSAMNNVVTPTQTSNNVSDATAGAAQGQGYTSTSANNAQWNVAAPQTVAGQLSNDLDPSSQLMQKAQADAAQTANGRGLLNSAMAAGAGTGALLDRALQIATPDAQTNAQAASQNASSLNTTNQFNAGQTNAAASQTAQAQSAANLQNAQEATGVSEANAAAQNQATQFDAGQSLQAQTANQSAAVSTATTAFNAATQTMLQNASDANKVGLQKMVSDTQAAIENVDAAYKSEMQTSQSAQGMYSTTMQSLTSIMQDQNLDGPSKQNLINIQMQGFINAMNLQMGVSNIGGVASLVSNLGSGVTGSQGTTDPITGTVTGGGPVSSGVTPPPPSGYGSGPAFPTVPGSGPSGGYGG